MCLFSFTNSCADTIRGMGRSTLAAAITFFTTCVFRVLWIYTVFQAYQTMAMIYVSHPVSWLLTGVLLLVTTMRLMKKDRRERSEAGGIMSYRKVLTLVGAFFLLPAKIRHIVLTRRFFFAILLKTKKGAFFLWFMPMIFWEIQTVIY